MVEYRSNKGPMWFAMGMLGMVGLLDLIQIGMHVRVLGVLSDALAGNPPPDAALLAMDAQAVMVAFAYTGVLLLTAVAFLIWQRTAVANLVPLRASPQYTPGWSVLYWFIPIVSLFRPYQVIKDAWIGSSADPGDSGANIVTFWWLGWIMNIILTRVEVSMSGLAQTPQEIRTASYVAIVSSLVSVATAGLIIKIVRDLTRRQEIRHQQPPAAAVFD